MFTRRFVATLAGTTLTAATLGLTALGMAATAGAVSSADNDNTFLAQLQADGITAPSPAVAISDAHGVCTALNQGQSAKQVIAEVAQTTGLSAKGSKTFAVDSASAYCPQYVTSS
jgi:hypothetical protein